MKIVLKRIGAYLIDIILVSLVATLLTANSYINKDYKKYIKTYDEYNSEYNKYSDYYTKLENYYEDKKLSEKEYNKLIELDNKYLDVLKEKYEDKNINEEEYSEVIDSLNLKYQDIDTNYSYKLLKYSWIPTIVNLMCIMLYFIVIQFYFGGQTLGKKILKLKIVSNNDKKLNIVNFLIRSLVVNELFINILNVIFLFVLSKGNYLVYNKIIYVVTYILEMVILFTIVFDKHNRGLHDYISNTKVVELNKE